MAEWLKELSQEIEQAKLWRQRRNELEYEFYRDHWGGITGIVDDARIFLRKFHPEKNYSTEIPQQNKIGWWELTKGSPKDEEEVFHISISSSIYNNSDKIDVNVQVWTKDSDDRFKKIDEVSRGQFSVDWLRWSILRVLRKEVGL